MKPNQIDEQAARHTMRVIVIMTAWVIICLLTVALHGFLFQWWGGG